jgi:hypothetical protein
MRATELAPAIAALVAILLAPVREGAAHPTAIAPTDDGALPLVIDPAAGLHPWAEGSPWRERPIARACFVVDPVTLQACAASGRRPLVRRFAVVPMVSRSRLGIALVGRF